MVEAVRKAFELVKDEAKRKMQIKLCKILSLLICSLRVICFNY